MQHVRFNALAMILVISTVMLITIDESQGSVFAQNSTSTMNSAPIMPASETSGNDDDDDNDRDHHKHGHGKHKSDWWEKEKAAREDHRCEEPNTKCCGGNDDDDDDDKKEKKEHPITRIDVPESKYNDEEESNESSS